LKVEDYVDEKPTFLEGLKFTKTISEN